MQLQFTKFQSVCLVAVRNRLNGRDIIKWIQGYRLIRLDKVCLMLKSFVTEKWQTLILEILF